MAFNTSSLVLINSVVELIEKRENSMQYQKKLGSIGYPDLIIKKSNLKGKIPEMSYQYLENNMNAMKWHNLSSSKYSFFSIEKFIANKGWQFEFLDIDIGTGKSNNTDAIRKNYIEMDLNLPIPDHLYCSYDILIDSGSAEHCFNIGQVFENYFYMLKPGGVLVQYIPFYSPNHGFWSFNPTALFDLSRYNPIKIMFAELQSYKSYHHYFDDEKKLIKYSPLKRFSVQSDYLDGVVLFAFCYKKLSKSIFRYPIQAKYDAKA